MKKDRDILFEKGLAKFLFPFIFGGVFICAGAVFLCFLKVSYECFVLGLFFIICGILITSVYLLYLIGQSTFAILDEEGISYFTFYKKLIKSNRWTEIKHIVIKNVFQKNTNKPVVIKSIVMYFSIANDFNEDNYFKLEYNPQAGILYDSKRNREILQKYLPEQFRNILCDVINKSIFVKGNVFYAYPFIFITAFTFIISMILLIAINKILLLILLFALYVICFVIFYVYNLNKPKRLKMNMLKIEKNGLNDYLFSVANWSDIKKVTKLRTKWKSEYIVMNFSDEDVEGKTLKELIDSPHVMVAKLNKRSRKILLQFLPEQFKERI